MDRSEAARFLGSLPERKRFERTCPICKTVFMATARGRYCSANCRAKAQTRRKTEARQARRAAEALVAESAGGKG